MIYAFGAYRLDTDLGELHGPLGAVALEPKCFALLRHLVVNRARSVSKDEIFEVIWPGVFVSDAALSTAIKQVRAAVGDSGQAQAVIKTVRGFGYRFVADVEP
ncbi:winged helix-turn-helix domain-containing protein [Dinoroseobacter sp. S124A]|uniref:winged helix-turn-helix domain-containing protein n=1 Tax=Dinoroseobacter sp. S124A TaxID=3415128 RepID=UPI003C7AB695